MSVVFPESLLPTIATRAGAAVGVGSAVAAPASALRALPAKSSMVLMLRNRDSSGNRTSATRTSGRISTMRCSPAREQRRHRLQAPGAVHGEQRLVVLADRGDRHVAVPATAASTRSSAPSSGVARSTAMAKTGRRTSCRARRDADERRGARPGVADELRLVRVAEVEDLVGGERDDDAVEVPPEKGEVALQQGAPLEDEVALVDARAPAAAAGEQHADADGPSGVRAHGALSSAGSGAGASRRATPGQGRASLWRRVLRRRTSTAQPAMKPRARSPVANATAAMSTAQAVSSAPSRSITSSMCSTPTKTSMPARTAPGMKAGERPSAAIDGQGDVQPGRRERGTGRARAQPVVRGRAAGAVTERRAAEQTAAEIGQPHAQAEARRRDPPGRGP